MTSVTPASSFPRPPRNRDGVLTLFPGSAPHEPATQQEDFAATLAKYLREDVSLAINITVNPGPGPFGAMEDVSLGLMAERVADDEGRVSQRVVFEIGATASPREIEKRLIRDATLLDRDLTDAVYRIRRVDLVYCLPDVLFMISRLDPGLFSERGLINLQTLSSREAREASVRPDQQEFRLGTASSTVSASREVEILRLDRRFPAPWREFATPRLRRVATHPSRLAG